MSTRIYSGFRYGTANIHQFLGTVELFRPFIIKAGEDLYDRFLENVQKLPPNPTKDDFFHARFDADVLWMKLRRELKATGIRNPVVDTEFSIVIYPDTQCLYGHTFTEHPDWHDQWLKMPNVEDFSYWNNSDEPDGMSEDEWQRRAKVWDAIFAKCSIPAMRGLSIDVHESNGPMPAFLRKR